VGVPCAVPFRAEMEDVVGGERSVVQQASESLGYRSRVVERSEGVRGDLKTTSYQMSGHVVSKAGAEEKKAVLVLYTPSGMGNIYRCAKVHLRTVIEFGDKGSIFF